MMTSPSSKSQTIGPSCKKKVLKCIWTYPWILTPYATMIKWNQSLYSTFFSLCRMKMKIYRRVPSKESALFVLHIRRRWSIDFLHFFNLSKIWENRSENSLVHSFVHSLFTFFKFHFVLFQPVILLRLAFFQRTLSCFHG